MLFEALYGPLIDAISVGLELPSDLEFQGEVKQISVPVRRWMQTQLQTLINDTKRKENFGRQAKPFAGCYYVLRILLIL